MTVIIALVVGMLAGAALCYLWVDEKGWLR